MDALKAKNIKFSITSTTVDLEALLNAPTEPPPLNTDTEGDTSGADDIEDFEPGDENEPAKKQPDEKPAKAKTEIAKAPLAAGVVLKARMLRNVKHNGVLHAVDSDVMLDEETHADFLSKGWIA